jgi:phosphate starvation-inducible membrane PsiE
MTTSVMLGLTLQTIAVAIVHRAIKGAWIARVGALFILTAVVYHGLTEVVQAIFPGRNPYRNLVDQSARDDWVILVSAAILLFAVAYAAIISNRTPPPAPAPVEFLARIRLAWLLLPIAPLLVAALQGRGSIQRRQADAAASNYLVDGLVIQFLVFLVAASSALILVRYGTRWTIPLFAAQGTVLAFAGARAMVVAACLLSLYGAAQFRVKPPTRQLVGAAALLAMLVVSISSARAVVGREQFAENSGAGQRLVALAEGVSSLGSSQSQQAILDDIVYRFDGNSFGAMVLGALERNFHTVGLTTTKNNLSLAVPSFVNPDKLSASLSERNEEVFLDNHFGLVNHIDYLPGVFGTLLGYFGPLGLLVMALTLGAIFALIDVVVVERPRPGVLVIGLGLAACALSYEQGPAAYATTMRGVLLIALVIGICRALRRRTPETEQLGSLHPSST